MPRKAQQIPLDFQHAPARSRDDLVLSERLRAAVGVVDRWPDWPSPVVILAGPPGAGKSHLASIWRERADALSLDATTTESDAVAAATAGSVLVEDVERAGFSDAFLFHLINAVREAGTGLLMTTRTWPAAWPVALPDLASRLRAATVVEIGAPDEDLLAQVIQKLFADRQLSVDPKVVGYMVNRMERSLETAQAVVQQIDRLALSRRARVTRALAGEVLDAIAPEDDSDDDSGADDDDNETS